MAKLENNLFYLSGQDDGFDPYGWHGLPEFVQEVNEAPFVLAIHVKNKEDLHALSDLIKQPNLKNDNKGFTKSIWYPILIPGERGSDCNRAWVDVETIKEKYGV